MIYKLARSALFRLDAESAHHLTLASLAHAAPLAQALYGRNTGTSPRQVMGLSFPNPVGLAAGLDKDGACIDGLAALGFGFLEIGTVTPRAQPGNPRPRMFRLPREQALINRLGFNNRGVDHLLARLRASRFANSKQGILGINIGKNFDTPIERAADDYLHCLREIYPWASYVTINISSPNTENLRDLQGEKALDQLLASLKSEQARLADRHGQYKPLAVKIAPDLDDKAIGQIANLLIRHELDAVIATNTTVGRPGLAQHPLTAEKGGLSGAPLFDASTEALASLAKALDGALPIIGVGGITSGAQARAKIDAGASLVQIYTGLIYRGPSLVQECVRALR